ncbi:MAG: replicative DNA helicase [Candidatus Phytoplasma asteris]|uniref:Replicative DNA helicase n=1 Tax='Chrysanthemum coronarium' phytoplasma TaxID=1520703 RepID=A0ABQ0J385_9MOLU|nr:MAG: replicative DNA helicase [Candidatus Phytoplasma asteris]GAK74029.1 replicative DNA helicase ['Chrysanthemum coronarium' phytoplasma]
MLTNEQKALKQIISYMNQNKADQLNFYFDLIDPQFFLDQKHKKIFQALKYLTLNQTNTHPFDKIKSQNEIIEELLTYLQTHFPQDHFTKESLSFLSDDLSKENNLNFLDNLKHTYTQEKLFQQLLKIISPSFENKDPYHKNLYYQEIFDKLRKFMSFIPHSSDKTLLTLNQMVSCHLEFFQFDQQAKQKIQEEY